MINLSRKGEGGVDGDGNPMESQNWAQAERNEGRCWTAGITGWVLLRGRGKGKGAGVGKW